MKKARILAWICIFNLVFLLYFSFSSYKIGIYNGESMNPVLIQNDLILLREFNPEKSEFKRGMIVSYENDGKRIIHRIIGVMKDRVIIKGDNNNINTDSPIPVSQIKEIYLFTLLNSDFVSNFISVIDEHYDKFFSASVILFGVLISLILKRRQKRDGN